MLRVERYKALIKQNMTPHQESATKQEELQLAQAMVNTLNYKMYEYDLAVAARQQADSEDDFLGLVFNIGKIAVIGAVAFFAPPLLPNAAPFIGAVGTASNAFATGVTCGLADAAMQGVGIGLGVQQNFSMNEMLETTVSCGVGAGTSGMHFIPQTLTVAAAASGTQLVEMGLGTRDKFDAAAVGLQAASNIIAHGLKEAMPAIDKTFGADGSIIASTVAKTAINSVLNSVVQGAPLDLKAMTENVVGSIIGQKIGSNILANHTPLPLNAEQLTIPKATLELKSPRYGIEPALSNALGKDLKVDVSKLIAEGRWSEAKKIAIERGKAVNMPKQPTMQTVKIKMGTLAETHERFNERAIIVKQTMTNVANNQAGINQLQDNYCAIPDTMNTQANDNYCPIPEVKIDQSQTNNNNSSNSVTLGDQLTYIKDHPKAVLKEFWHQMANPKPAESQSSDGYLTKAMNALYNSSAKCNQALQQDLQQGKYGSAVAEVAKPFVEVVVIDATVGIAAPLVRPGLNAVSSSLGGAAYSIDYLADNATQLAKPALDNAAAILSKMGLYTKPTLINEIVTPYGAAIQSKTEAAMQAKQAVEQGARIYRGGKLGQSAGPEAQFWSLENPMNSGYAERYGIPLQNTNFDFVEVAILKPGSKFITREAPGIDVHSGGGIEVVVKANEPKLEYFHMPKGIKNDPVKQPTIPRNK